MRRDLITQKQTLNKEQLESYISEHYKGPCNFSWYDEYVMFDHSGAINQKNEISYLRQRLETLQGYVDGHIRDKCFMAGQLDERRKSYDDLLKAEWLYGGEDEDGGVEGL